MGFVTSITVHEDSVVSHVAALAWSTDETRAVRRGQSEGEDCRGEGGCCSGQGAGEAAERRRPESVHVKRRPLRSKHFLHTAPSSGRSHLHLWRTAVVKCRERSMQLGTCHDTFLGKQ